jgi:hypothetical protein
VAHGERPVWAAPCLRAGRIYGVTFLLGIKERFALEIGERVEGMRRVDAWMAGQWLTCDDKMAYVPQLRVVPPARPGPAGVSRSPAVSLPRAVPFGRSPAAARRR